MPRTLRNIVLALGISLGIYSGACVEPMHRFPAYDAGNSTDMQQPNNHQNTGVIERDAAISYKDSAYQDVAFDDVAIYDVSQPKDTSPKTDSNILLDAGIVKDAQPQDVCVSQEKSTVCGCNEQGRQKQLYDCQKEEWVNISPCNEVSDCCPGDRRLTDIACACDGLAGQLEEVCRNGRYVVGQCRDVPECCPGDRRVIVEQVCEGESNRPGHVIQGCIEFEYQPICCEIQTCESLSLADIVFVIDRSGSMQDEIRIVLTGLEQFLEQLGEDNRYRFGILDVPPIGLNGQALDGQVGLRLNLTSYQNILDELRRELNELNEGRGLGGGREATYGAIYDVATPDNPQRLDFRDDAKKYVVLLTDEVGQPPARQPPLCDWRLCESFVRGVVQENNVAMYGFVPFESPYVNNPRAVVESFDSIILTEDGLELYGRLFDLNLGQEHITNSLTQMFSEIEECIDPCGDHQ